MEHYPLLMFMLAMVSFAVIIAFLTCLFFGLRHESARLLFSAIVIYVCPPPVTALLPPFSPYTLQVVYLFFLVVGITAIGGLAITGFTKGAKVRVAFPHPPDIPASSSLPAPRGEGPGVPGRVLRGSGHPPFRPLRTHRLPPLLGRQGRPPFAPSLIEPFRGDGMSSFAGRTVRRAAAQGESPSTCHKDVPADSGDAGVELGQGDAQPNQASLTGSSESGASDYA